MAFMKMVSMERSDAEKAAERIENTFPTPINDMPDVPYGLSISLTERELEKLDLSDDAEVGDCIMIYGMARVTSISKQETNNGCKCRVELALTDLCVIEPDDAEEEAEGETE